MQVCGYTFDGVECAGEGEHFCLPRADLAQTFFEEALFHTKGQFVRRRFILTDWQRDEIVRPLFGTVVWSDECQRYVRRYQWAWLEMARKNGKTELLAGIMLYLLMCDGEESGEIYGVARDITQAKLAFDVAAQMVLMSPALSRHLQVSDYKKRIYRAKTNSFYQVIAADAKSALGSNPSGVAADEILAWQDRGMWDSMWTGMGSGARIQPLMVAATTAGNDTESFAGEMHKQMERVVENPDLPENRHIFVFMRNTPMDDDPWNEDNWWHANPALGDFLSLEKMRTAAYEARANPLSEMAFRQFRLNQWQKSTLRWMDMQQWDGDSVVGIGNRSTFYGDAERTFAAFEGYDCWFGLDLAARKDLCAMCYVFPTDDPSYGLDVLWRFWMPEAAVKKLDRLNDNKFSKLFVENGWLTVTEGQVLNFEKFYADIEDDSRRFNILGGDVDKYGADPIIQEIRLRTGIGVEDIFAYENNYSTMSDGMHRIYELVASGIFRHHGNPLARWCFDACEAKYRPNDPDKIMPVKPDRLTAAKRIDAVPAAIMAVNAWITRDDHVSSIYATEDVFVV